MHLPKCRKIAALLFGIFFRIASAERRGYSALGFVALKGESGRSLVNRRPAFPRDEMLRFPS
jgi:hypothetical protein